MNRSEGTPSKDFLTEQIKESFKRIVTKSNEKSASAASSASSSSSVKKKPKKEDSESSDSDSDSDSSNSVSESSGSDSDGSDTVIDSSDDESTPMSSKWEDREVNALKEAMKIHGSNKYKAISDYLKKVPDLLQRVYKTPSQCATKIHLLTRKSGPTEESLN
ncbi:MAG: SANT/Myb domain-containing protein [Parachlamydiaceae bacterium]|nr:SANT/Myb domain-containing protein [Parachlamydiaceae bacterium]